MMKKDNFKGLVLVLTLLMSIPLFAQGVPEKPRLQKPVYDYGNVLSADQERSLDAKLIRYSDTTSTQIVVVTMKNIGGRDISAFGVELGHEWGIGQRGKDNGVLLLIALEERRINISTGYGVEFGLTDAMSRRIIETIIQPEFKAGNFYAGIDKGTDAIFEVLNGEFKGNPSNDSEGWSKYLGLILFILLWLLLSRGRRGGRGGRRGSDVLPWLILSGMGSNRSSGFGGGGFSSGGFSGGFGGGGFGGGGASGGW
jgi:uncharacterized protein